MISKISMKNYFEIKYSIKSDYREEIDVMEEVKIDPQGSIQLDKYHTWQYRKYPIFY